MSDRPQRLGGVHTGQLFTVRPEDFGRVGNCWMRGRLKEGDLIFSMGHSGDCFWTYCLVEHDVFTVHGQGLYKLIPESSFGAYVLGELYPSQPTDREVHLLLAGEGIPLDADSPGGFTRRPLEGFQIL